MYLKMLKNYYAFISYARKDDEIEKGKIAALAQRLEELVTLHSGIEFRIFFDKESIGWGYNWSGTIESAIEESFFLIPFVTPTYFGSVACEREYKLFLTSHERISHDSIFPIYYVSVNERHYSEGGKGEWHKSIFSQQYRDWRQIRTQEKGSPDVESEIDSLAKRMAEVLTENMKPPGILTRPDVLSEIEKMSIAKEKTLAKYDRLGDTQKLIIDTLYTQVHPSEISLQDLLTLLKNKHGDDLPIGSIAELYYRCRDLLNQELIFLLSLGRKNSIVIGIPRVQEILIDSAAFGT